MGQIYDIVSTLLLERLLTEGDYQIHSYSRQQLAWFFESQLQLLDLDLLTKSHLVS